MCLNSNWVFAYRRCCLCVVGGFTQERELSAPSAISEREVAMLEKYREWLDTFRSSPFSFVTPSHSRKSVLQVVTLSDEYFPKEIVDGSMGRRPREGGGGRKPSKRKAVVSGPVESGAEGEEEEKTKKREDEDADVDAEPLAADDDEDLDDEYMENFQDDEDGDNDSLAEGEDEGEATF
eukprot:ANDGO_02700.mRNA.2 hypothetical protein